MDYYLKFLLKQQYISRTSTNEVVGMRNLTQGERLVKIETHLEDITVQVSQMNKKLDNLDDKFAGKWIEKVTVGVSVTVIGSVITALIILL